MFVREPSVSHLMPPPTTPQAWVSRAVEDLEEALATVVRLCENGAESRCLHQTLVAGFSKETHLNI